MTIGEHLRLAMGSQVSAAIQFLDKGVNLEKVDPLTQSMRITICEGCPRFNKETRQCLECTCKMDYKTTLATNPLKILSGETDPKELKITCPLHKW